MKTVLLVDDHPIFMSGLKKAIEFEGIYKVVGEAENGPEGLRMALKLKPDVVITDLKLPGMTGIGLAEKIRAVLENTYVIILSAYSDIRYVKDAVRAGVRGYMVKESGSEGVLKCLEAVAAGKRFADRGLSEVFFGGFQDDPGESGLTAREQEIMRLLVEGFGLREIGANLCISYKTVTVHKTSIMKKLGVRNDVELVRYAISAGMIDPDVWKYGPGPV